MTLLLLGLLAQQIVTEAPVAGLIVKTTVGAETPVMVYRRDSCRASGGLDLPDVQARAFRRPDGQLVLVSGNAPVNYFLTGPDFDRLTRNCNPVLTSGDKPDAASFDNQEWILATWIEGNIIHALVHNEYHDPVSSTCRQGVTDPSNPCWWNAITYARSNDGGRTFTQVPAPGHVVAALPTPWNPENPLRPGTPPAAHGYFTPSNIVPGGDGYFYSMFMSIADPRTSAQGTCVMRTNNLADPQSWRAWDGRDYTLSMRSPYPQATGLPPCTPVSRATIGGLHGSLTWNTYLNRFVLTGNYATNEACGSWISHSADLIHWSNPQLVLEGTLPYPPCNKPEGAYIYPSLIDHASTSANFETTGRQPHLYYVRWNQGLDRDLVRRPLQLEAQAAIVNAASFAAEGVAPGQIMTLFGERLAGARVLFDGEPALVFSSATGQVNLEVPLSLGGKQSTRIEIEVAGRRSTPVSAPVIAPTPGLFTLAQNGKGQAAALLPDYSVNGPANPAPRGGFLLLYGTAGQISEPVTATIGGIAAEITYAGIAPGFSAGALQVNVLIPANAPTGNAVPVRISVGGRQSQTDVSVAIR